MVLRVEAGSARQLLQLRTEALAQKDAELARLQSSLHASWGGAGPPDAATGSGGGGGSAKEVARLRAALAVSEDQRRRDAAAAEREAGKLREEIERLRARRPGTAAAPTTPDRRRAPPPRRGSASSGRSEDPSAGPPAAVHPTSRPLLGPHAHGPPNGGHPEQRCSLPAAEEPRWQAAGAAGALMLPPEADRASADAHEANLVGQQQEELARWQEHCAALETELRALRALVAQGMLQQERLQPQPSDPSGPGSRADVFPLESYLSAWPPSGLTISAAWRQLSDLAGSPLQPAAPPEALPPAPPAGAARSDGGWSADSDDSCADVDGDLDTVLHALEAAVLRSPPPGRRQQPQAHVEEAERAGAAQRGARTPEAAEQQLGSVRSDIVAALQRRGDLQAELGSLRAKICAAESELTRLNSEASPTSASPASEGLAACLA